MTRKPIGLTAPYRLEKKMPMEIHKDKIVMRAGKYDLPRPWVGLTDDEIKHIEETTTCLENESWLRNLTRNIEAKLKEKNT